MLFNSIPFLFFFPIVVLIFFVTKQKYKGIVLLLSSYVFYMAWHPLYITLILCSTIIDYVAAIKIEKNTLGKKKYLYLSLVTNLGILFVFKYFNFFCENLFALIPSLESPTIKLLLPVGISFYTFQTMSYTIDVYRGQKKAEKNLGVFALYVSFFPQLVAGPIERSTTLLPQLKKDFRFDYQNTVAGGKLMAWGFFKKVVIADRLATFVDPVFSSPEGWTGVSYVTATIFFAVQIYCDFSGYTDIAIGGAKFFGINLMDNFKRPYYSKSISEFWQRWHISLSTWFKDYVYVPLGGNRISETRTSLNLFITFLISGLWHGANWTFIMWGALNGLYIVLERKYSSSISIFYNLSIFRRFVMIKKGIQVFTTFTLICFSWIFFRAESLSDAIHIVTHLHTGWADLFYNLSNSDYIKSVFAMGQRKDEFILSVLSIFILEVFHLAQRRGSLRLRMSTKPFFIRWIISIVLIMSIIALGFFEKNQFIYFQF